MRKILLDRFDKIYILDLHGNARKKERALDGGKDENIFDIMQGVSITIFIKTGKKKTGELADVFHFDLHGRRDEKYAFLKKNTLSSMQWNKLKPEASFYFSSQKISVMNQTICGDFL
ncbi:MAG: hypothetical protein LBG90_00200 [Spirochaetaceae bacterium]|jgi:predicted helicase|nr:hypothetical protein [Spirochaetaceae bacterium]